MFRVENICSLTDFQRNIKEYMKRLKETGQPEILTVNGKAELVVQDAEAYQNILDLVDRVEAINGIRRGLEDIEEGRTHKAEDVHEELRRM